MPRLKNIMRNQKITLYVAKVNIISSGPDLVVKVCLMQMISQLYHSIFSPIEDKLCLANKTQILRDCYIVETYHSL